MSPHPQEYFWTNEMLIRPAAFGDDEAIWAMLEPVFRAGDTYAIDPDISQADAIAYWTAPAKSTFVVESDGAVLGTYYLVRNTQGGGSHVCNCGFVTATAARGRGVAQAMLDHALEEAGRQGFHAMQFNFVVETNAGAIRLWERAGFETVGRLPRAFLHPDLGYVDARVMWKDLAFRPHTAP